MHRPLNRIYIFLSFFFSFQRRGVVLQNGGITLPRVSLEIVIDHLLECRECVRAVLHDITVQRTRKDLFSPGKATRFSSLQKASHTPTSFPGSLLFTPSLASWGVKRTDTGNEVDHTLKLVQRSPIIMSSCQKNHVSNCYLLDQIKDHWTILIDSYDKQAVKLFL